MSSNTTPGVSPAEFWLSLDPELAEALRAIPPAARSPVRPGDIRDRRAMLEAASQRTAQALRRHPGITRLDDLDVPGSEESQRLVLARPEANGQLLPCVLHIHGGGMIFGDRYLGLERTISWVETVGVAVASPDYRLAPERPYPAALEDGLNGLRWLQENANSLGISADHIILAGASAGGGIAAGMALWLRDHGEPLPAALMLMAPMLDDRRQSTSSSAFEGDAPWDPVSNQTGWAALLRDQKQDDVPPYAAPARGHSLAGLPPTFLDVGSADIFADEVIDFARRLSGDGVPVELHVWAGAYHGFDLTAPTAEISIASQAARLSYLRRAIGTPGRAT